MACIMLLIFFLLKVISFFLFLSLCWHQVYFYISNMISSNCFSKQFVLLAVVSFRNPDLPFNNTLDWTKFSVIASEKYVPVDDIIQQLQDNVKDIEDEKTLVKLFSNLHEVIMFWCLYLILFIFNYVLHFTFFLNNFFPSMLCCSRRLLNFDVGIKKPINEKTIDMNVLSCIMILSFS